MKLSPVLIVPAIEPCLPFWKDRMGFTTSFELPGFCMLVREGVEIMLQTQASVREDEPRLSHDGTPGGVTLFM